MFQRLLGILISTAFAVSLAAAPNNASSQAQLSSAQIVDKNVANQRAALPVPVSNQEGMALPRRPAEEVRLPFLMELKRPRKMRLELQVKDQTAVQVYDGTNGWKLRPFLNRHEV